MSVEIKDARLMPLSKDQLIKRETGFKAGNNGHCDLTLIKRDAGYYELEMFMKVQFFFIDGDEDATGWTKKDEYKWTAEERKKFLHTWHSHVKAAWSQKKVAVLSDGKSLSVCLRFHVQEGGWMWDHFEIDVLKIPSSAKHSTSYVQRAVLAADVILDSKDFTSKASGQKAAIHEFGHMIGLPDEYKSSSPHFTDKTSLMNTGTTVKPRHYNHVVAWVEKQIKQSKP